MDKVLRVAIAGAGMMGQAHIDALRRIPWVEVVAVADSHGKPLEAMEQSQGMPRFYTDWNQMLQETKPDAVHVCLPNVLHYEACKKAIEAGCHVFCEKPLAMGVAQGEELCRLAQKHHVGTGINFNYRHNAAVREIRERILSQDAGSIYLVHGSYLQDWLMYDTDYSWRLDPKENGASRAIADIGSHWFDTVQYATGRKIISVFATTFTAITQRKKPVGQVQTFQQVKERDGIMVPVHTEDGAVIQLRLDNGVLGALVVSQVSGGHKNALNLEVDCSSYSMVWNQEDADKLWVSSRRQGKQIIYTSPSTLQGGAREYDCLPEGHAGNWRDALLHSIKSFYLSICDGSYVGEAHDYATFRDGCNIMRLVDACLESSQKGCWIDIQ